MTVEPAARDLAGGEAQPARIVDHHVVDSGIFGVGEVGGDHAAVRQRAGAVGRNAEIGGRIECDAHRRRVRIIAGCRKGGIARRVAVAAIHRLERRRRIIDRDRAGDGPAALSVAASICGAGSARASGYNA